MKYCDYCGKEIPAESVFCPECGAKLTHENQDDESTVLLTSNNGSTDPYYSPYPSKKDNSKRLTMLIALVLSIFVLTVAAIFIVKMVKSSGKEDTKKEEVEDQSNDKKKSKEAEEDKQEEPISDTAKPQEAQNEPTGDIDESKPASPEPATGENEDILHIRAVYNDIMTGISNGTYIHYGDESAGGYADRDHIVKRIDLSPGQSHVDPSSTEQYYYEYAGGKYNLVFVYSSVNGNDQNRYYFKDGTMIRWITPDKQYHARDAEYNQREETLYSQGNHEIALAVGRGD